MVVLVGGKFLSKLWELTESALGTLLSWAANYGLFINPNKIDLVLFSKFITFRWSRLGGRDLPLSSEVKDLGVVLDS